MHRILIPLLVLLLPSIALSQACSCEEAGECLIVLPVSSTNTVCYTIGDALNNDLSNPDQGICGVRINFSHAFVWDLEVSLTSPGGQTVDLIGDQVLHFGIGSIAAHWDIVFVPNSETAEPDTVGTHNYTAQWDNDQTWLLGGQYNGSYYPVHADVAGGSLEDFNTGPVNGTWCLTITNHHAQATTYLYDFSVIPCDRSGIICCDADAGTFSHVSDIVSCEGDSSLVLGFGPRYGTSTPPDPAVYDYTYIISQNDVILDYQESPNLIAYPAGVYNVCGFSYKAEDVDDIPAPDGNITVTDLVADITDGVPLLCGNVADDCVQVTIVTPPDPVDIEEAICQGDTVVFSGTPYFESGDYQITLSTSAQCDSVINYHLTVIEIDTVLLSETICDGRTFTVGTMDYNASGVFTTVLQTDFPCDSVVILDLHVLDPIVTNVADTICQGEQYEFGGTNYNTSGSYTHVFQSYLGCDSLVNLDLVVVSLQIAIDRPVGILDCNNSTVALTATAAANFDDVIIDWTTDDGQFSSIDSLQATVDMPGNYTATISGGGCVVSQNITVEIDTISPVSDAGEDKMLNCRDSVLILDGSNSSDGSDYTYQWLGGVASGQGTNTATVNTSGIYSLIVTDVTNGCKDTSIVNVGSDEVLPDVEAGAPDTLTCVHLTASIGDADNTSTGGEFTYSWSNSNGEIISESILTNVDYADIFWLNVTNTTTGCHNRDSVAIQNIQVPITAIIDFPDTLKCNRTQVTLHGDNSTHVLNYHWSTTTGHIVSDVTGSTLQVDQPGTYQLVVDTLGGCADTTAIVVVIDTLRPFADGGEDQILNCRDSTVVLDGSNSSAGAAYSYQWLGGIAAGQGTNTATVNNSGIYTLIVNDLRNGCTDTSVVNVGSDDVLPDVEAGASDTLTCVHLMTTIGDADNTSTGDEFTYYWLNNEGQQISESIEIDVDSAGVFWLNVTNTTTGCHNRDSVAIQNIQVPITATIDLPDTLNCSQNEVTLHGDNSLHVLNYHWSTTTGHILSDVTGSTLQVDQPGNYQLIVDTLGGCSDTTDIIVAIDTLRPFSDAGENQILNCRDSIVILDGSNSSSGDNYDYQWLGGIVAGQGTNTATVNNSGIYTLIVNDLRNGCTDTSVVNVGSNDVLPDVEAGFPDTLTCVHLTTTIGDADNTSTGDEFTYSWSNSDGETISDSILTNVDSAGVFWLNVTNTTTGCHNRDSVVLSYDTIHPVAFVVSPDAIDCNADTVLLDGSNSTSINTTYEWIEEVAGVGGLVDGQGTPTAQVVVAGNYDLVVTDTTNFCTDTAYVAVVSTSELPDAEAGDNTFISCNLTSQTIGDSLGTSVGDEFDYIWTNSSGDTVSHEILAFVNYGDTFTFSVINTVTGCENHDDVFVNPLVFDVEAVISPPDTLDCRNDYVVLDGNNSSYAGSYSWTTAQGSVIGTGSTVDVEEPGMYYLHVDTIGGCFGVDSVLVIENNNDPVADAGVDVALDCLTGTAQIGGSNTSEGGYTYFWTAIDGGHFISTGDRTTKQIGVDSAGTYVLSVTDTLLGCIARDTVVATVDCKPEVQVVALNGLIDCIQTIDTLQGTYFPVGDNISYHWYGPGIVEDDAETNLEQVIYVGGTYTLIVTNETFGISDTATVYVEERKEYPDTLHMYSGELTCYQVNPYYELASEFTEVDSLEYLWSTGTGQFYDVNIDQLHAKIVSSGTYDLEITNPFSNCWIDLSVELSLPLIDVNGGLDKQFMCEDFTIELTPSEIPDSSFIEWTTLDGLIKPNEENIAFPEVIPSFNLNQTEFVITVTDTTNGCAATDTVLVFAPENCDCAVAFANSHDMITCDNPTVDLVETLDNYGDGFIYTWIDANGDILGTGANLTTDFIGDVNLYVLDSVYGTARTTCDIEILSDLERPEIEAIPNQTVDCLNTSVELSISNVPADADWVYHWETPFGMNDNPTITTTQEGDYSLYVKNRGNGCYSDTISVHVNVDTLHPVGVDAGPPSELTCQNNTLALHGAPNDAATYSYFWSTNNGNITPGLEVFPNTQIHGAGTYYFTVTYPDNHCSTTDSVIISQDASIPIVRIKEDSLIWTCLDTIKDFHKDEITSTGIQFAQEWFTLDATSLGNGNQITPGHLGGYVFQVTNTANGCVIADTSYVVDHRAAPAVTIVEPVEINCNNQMPNLQGSYEDVYGDPCSFEWFGDASFVSGEETLTPIVNLIGNYTLVVTNDSTGCTNQATVEVTKADDIPQIPIISADTITCRLTEVILDGSHPTHNGNISYSWSTMNGGVIIDTITTIPRIRAGAAGDYLLVISDTLLDCSVETMVTVTADILPPEAVISDTVSTITCNTLEVSLDATQSIPDNISYYWTTDDGYITSSVLDAVISVRESAWYFVEVTNARNGCKDSDSIFVAENKIEPTVEIVDPQELTCSADTVTLTGIVPMPLDSYSFLWTSPFGNDIIDEDQLVAQVTTGGTYVLHVTDNLNGCEGTANTVVDANIIKPIARANTLGDLNCETIVVKLSGAGSTTGDVSYLWETASGNIQDGENTLSPEVTESAWYTLSVTSLENGCTGVDSTFVEEIGSSITGVELNITHPDCRGQEFGSVIIDTVYGATYPLLYGISPDKFEDYNFFITLDVGNYSVYVQDVYGCEYDTTFAILPTGDIDIDIGEDIDVPLGDSIHIHADISVGNSPVDTIVWEPAEMIPCEGCPEQHFIPISSGKVKATVVDENGCEAWDVMDINVHTERPFYIPSGFSPNGDNKNDLLTVYPGKGLKKINRIAIFDRWGNRVFSADNIPAGAPFSGWDGTFEGQKLNPQVLVWHIDVEYLNGAIESFAGDVTLVR